MAVGLTSLQFVGSAHSLEAQVTDDVVVLSLQWAEQAGRLENQVGFPRCILEVEFYLGNLSLCS